MDSADVVKSISRLVDVLNRSWGLGEGTNESEPEGPTSPAEMGVISEAVCMLSCSAACGVSCGISSCLGRWRVLSRYGGTRRAVHARGACSALAEAAEATHTVLMVSGGLVQGDRGWSEGHRRRLAGSRRSDVQWMLKHQRSRWDAQRAGGQEQEDLTRAGCARVLLRYGWSLSFLGMK